MSIQHTNPFVIEQKFESEEEFVFYVIHTPDDTFRSIRIPRPPHSRWVFTDEQELTSWWLRVRKSTPSQSQHTFIYIFVYEQLIWNYGLIAFDPSSGMYVVSPPHTRFIPRMVYDQHKHYEDGNVCAFSRPGTSKLYVFQFSLSDRSFKMNQCGGTHRGVAQSWHWCVNPQQELAYHSSRVFDFTEEWWCVMWMNTSVIWCEWKWRDTNLTQSRWTLIHSSTPRWSTIAALDHLLGKDAHVFEQPNIAPFTYILREWRWYTLQENICVLLMTHPSPTSAFTLDSFAFFWLHQLFVADDTVQECCRSVAHETDIEYYVWKNMSVSP